MDTQPAFYFEGFYIERDDKNNLSLYREEMVPVVKDGTTGRGKRGEPTGEFKQEKIWKGYYNSFMGAFGAAIEHLAEEGKDVSGLLKMVEKIEALKKDKTGLEKAIVIVEKKNGKEDE